MIGAVILFFSCSICFIICCCTVTARCLKLFSISKDDVTTKDIVYNHHIDRLISYFKMKLFGEDKLEPLVEKEEPLIYEV